MSQTIKAPRHGIGIVSNRKIPFRMWLNEQPRKSLKFRKEIQRSDENGWTVEEFALEAVYRGLDIRFYTAASWAKGTQPRTLRAIVQEKFPTVRF